MMSKTFLLALFAAILAVASAQVRGGTAAATRRRVRKVQNAASSEFDAKYLEISEQIGQSEIFKIKQRYLKEKMEDMPKEDKSAKVDDADLSMSLSMSLSLSMSIEGRKEKDDKEPKDGSIDDMSMSMSMSMSM